MKNILVKIEYQGTHYKGWQIQTPGTPTVEETIEVLLKRVFSEHVKLNACSRTDSGVHARGQVANFFAPKQTPLKKLMLGLNAMLPDDICIKDMVEVPMDFTARGLNSGKRYIYNISNSSIPKAIHNEFCWWVRQPLDLEAMRLAARDFIGTYDFSAFRGKGCQALSPVKEVTRVDMEVVDSGYYKDIKLIYEGSAFLRNMIRVMTGTLVEIGRGKLKADTIRKILETGKRENAGVTAPSKGLFLDEVFYDPDPFVQRNMDAWDKD